MLFEAYHWDIILGLGLPAAGALIFLIRHYIKKEKCFTLMKQKIERLEAETLKGSQTHKDIYDKMAEMNASLHLIMGKLGVEDTRR